MKFQMRSLYIVRIKGGFFFLVHENNFINPISEDPVPLHPQPPQKDGVR